MVQKKEDAIRRKNDWHVLAIIDAPEVTEKIRRHLGLWCGPPSGRPPPRKASGTWTREPYQDDPMPDYENVLTD